MHLTPDLATFTFQGVTTVTIDVPADTSTLTCHAKELTFTSIVVDDKNACSEHVNQTACVFAPFAKPLPQVDFAPCVPLLMAAPRCSRDACVL